MNSHEDIRAIELAKARSPNVYGATAQLDADVSTP
jgi:hypothetical protein